MADNKKLGVNCHKDNVFSVDFQVTDADISKEATTAEYIEKILPILLKTELFIFLDTKTNLDLTRYLLIFRLEITPSIFIVFQSSFFSNNNS